MAIKNYQNLFIDLDKTLWDFDRNAKQTFIDIFQKHELINKGIPDLDAFLNVYEDINAMLWGLYRENQIKKIVLNVRRFEMSLNAFGIDDLILATHIAEDYVSISPTKTILYDGCIEGLDYLQSKYNLHLITNGFEEVQQVKIDRSDLRKYFKSITTSEEAGVKKPNERIFNYAIRKASSATHSKIIPSECMMIGDDLRVDIEGAKSMGMDTMYFNPERIPHEHQPTMEMFNWKEIKNLL